MSNVITIARRHRAERAAWERLADRAAALPLVMPRRYLDANPERARLAELDGWAPSIAHVWCGACVESITTSGISTAPVAIAEHNITRHPRRWRAMQQFPGR